MLIAMMVGGAMTYVSGIMASAVTSARCFVRQIPVLALAVGSAALASYLLVPKYGLLGGAFAVIMTSTVLHGRRDRFALVHPQQREPAGGSQELSFSVLLRDSKSCSQSGCDGYYLFRVTESRALRKSTFRTSIPEHRSRHRAACVYQRQGFRDRKFLGAMEQCLRPRTLLELDSHFSFGENWSHYAEKIDEARIEEAEKSLIRLVGRENIEGKTFLDIGCGSGLFSLAAVRFGAKKAAGR